MLPATAALRFAESRGGAFCFVREGLVGDAFMAQDGEALIRSSKVKRQDEETCKERTTRISMPSGQRVNRTESGGRFVP